jgi:nucleoside-diphosphate-sugar epimerase
VRVLVTGDRGYIGAVLVPMLEERGIDVVGMDSHFYHGCGFGDAARETAGERRDIRDAAVQDLTGFDSVVHLAALSNDPVSDLDPGLTYEINHRAAVRLARLARSAGVARFVFSSSCSNYGASGSDLLDETAPFRPVAPYGISKVKAEKGLIDLATDNFSPVLLRSATAYGVSPQLRCDVVLNNLVAWAVATGKVHIKSDGAAWRPLVHVEDICQAFLAVLEAPRDAVHAEAFNVVAQGENYRICDVAATVAEVVGCDVEFAGDASPDARNYRVDGSKIAATLPAFQPQWDVRTGAEQLYKAFSNYPVVVDDFEGWRYRRIGQIKRLLNLNQLTPDLRWKGTGRCRDGCGGVSSFGDQA